LRRVTRGWIFLEGVVAVIYCKWIKSEIAAHRRGRRPEIVAVRWIL
jgi:hypothetical protein